MSSPVIVGIDEAGRGALAGPVVAGAVCMEPKLTEHTFITDSKKLTECEREQAFNWIEEHCTWGGGIVDAGTIDAEGILEATQKAMQLAVADLATKVTPTYLLVDGRDQFWFDYPHSSIVKGDLKEPCISAASIVAKVTRDRIMIDACQDESLYTYFDHKGYGTPIHLEEITTRGVSDFHRKTFLEKYTQKAVAPSR